MLNDAFITISNFQMFDSWEEIDLQLFFYFPENSAFSINFEECGYASTYLISNSSITVWTLYANGILFLVWFLCKMIITWCTNRIACLVNKLSTYLFWNGLIRLFMEIFFEVAFASALNLYTVDWDSPFPSVKYSNLLSWTSRNAQNQSKKQNGQRR